MQRDSRVTNRLDLPAAKLPYGYNGQADGMVYQQHARREVGGTEAFRAVQVGRSGPLRRG
jgi:hypothetical protein